ncbi:MAG TPA: 30S ribosome-binding factor RbfA [Candidatus Margulisiibacteriota bacterium]|nr:30S ribosome-binding factor RbfA [Candidatus Margulisiibacteriota bacterium]
MSARRADRVAEAVREVIAELLLRDIKDPRIGMITLTSVAFSDDLKHARVYFSCVGDSAVRERSLTGLRSAAGFIRSQVTRRLKLRYAPDLTFVFDPSLEAADRVATLLKDARARNE